MMSVINRWLFAIIALLLFYNKIPLVLAVDCGSHKIYDALTYQDRGDRCEGIKPKPVSGYDIELISAVVDYREVSKSKPDYFKLRFYLPHKNTPANVKVRELEYYFSYWMDKVNPDPPWGKGINDYQWSTQEVIKHLKKLNMYDLGVLVHLGNNRSSVKEHITPVIFYHSELPERISGYLFTFKTYGDVELEYDVIKQSTGTSVLSKEANKKLGVQRHAQPFQIRWKSLTAEEGHYKLILEGFKVSNYMPIYHTVSFYHQPNLHKTLIVH